jgi:hypothetical protein
VVGIALDGGGHAIFHRHQQRAGIGTVERAGRADLCGCHIWNPKSIYSKQYRKPLRALWLNSADKGYNWKNGNSGIVEK